MADEIDPSQLSEIPSELLILVFSLFLTELSRTIYELDYVEKRQDITAENFLSVLTHHILESKDHTKSYGVHYKSLQKYVDVLRQALLEIDIHRLMWPSSDDLD